MMRRSISHWQNLPESVSGPFVSRRQRSRSALTSSSGNRRASSLQKVSNDDSGPGSLDQVSTYSGVRAHYLSIIPLETRSERQRKEGQSPMVSWGTRAAGFPCDPKQRRIASANGLPSPIHKGSRIV